MTDPTATEDPAMRRLNAAIDAARPWLGQVAPPAIGQELACAFMAAPPSWLARFSEAEQQAMMEWAYGELERAAELALLTSWSGTDSDDMDGLAIPIQ